MEAQEMKDSSPLPMECQNFQQFWIPQKSRKIWSEFKWSYRSMGYRSYDLQGCFGWILKIFVTIFQTLPGPTVIHTSNKCTTVLYYNMDKSIFHSHPHNASFISMIRIPDFIFCIWIQFCIYIYWDKPPSKYSNFFSSLKECIAVLLQHWIF